MSEIASLYNKWLQNQLSEVHTCMPGKVIDFDAASQTCSVQPALKRLYAGDDEATELPVIGDVPVVFPGSGDFWITFDVKPDSYVLLVFSERSIAAWLELGGLVDPEARHKFSLSDAIAIPGLLPTPVALSNTGATALSNNIMLRNADGDTYVKVKDKEVDVCGYLKVTVP